MEGVSRTIKEMYFVSLNKIFGIEPRSFSSFWKEESFPRITFELIRRRVWKNTFFDLQLFIFFEGTGSRRYDCCRRGRSPNLLIETMEMCFSVYKKVCLIFRRAYDERSEGFRRTGSINEYNNSLLFISVKHVFERNLSKFDRFWFRSRRWRSSTCHSFFKYSRRALRYITSSNGNNSKQKNFFSNIRKKMRKNGCVGRNTKISPRRRWGGKRFEEGRKRERNEVSFWRRSAFDALCGKIKFK